MSFGGCAPIAGIEKRSESDDSDDPFGAFQTSELCQDYCSTVMSNCTGQNQVYLSMGACIHTCNSLDPGDPVEAGGNTVQCRLTQAQAAKSAPGELCVSAGPGGAPECGDNCDSWCTLLEAECPDEFAFLKNRSNCKKACAAIPDTGGLDTGDDYEDVDNLQCRLIHLGSVGRTQDEPDEAHCSHGSFIPTSRCLLPEEEEPECEEYCRIVTVTCTGEFAVYADKDQCMAACGALEPGERIFGLDTGTENTVGCRTYHARVAANNPGAHCPHSGPTGAGVCGTYDDSADVTGNCESYCAFLEEGCEDTFDAEYANRTDCEAQCKEDFKGNGADSGSSYSVRTATDEDNLQCRTYRAIEALTAAAGDEPDKEVTIVAACLKASPLAVCD